MRRLFIFPVIAVFAAAGLCAVLLVAFPKPLGGQAGGSQSQATESPMLTNERNLAARKKALLDEAADLEQMMKSLTGTEFSAAMQLDQKTDQGVLEVDAALWFIGIYEKMQCDVDREVAKTALQNRLGFYSHTLGIQADQAAGQLVFLKLPATAQAGARIRDELRASKNKLDEIATSLK
jgi:hypothetical protein